MRTKEIINLDNIQTTKTHTIPLEIYPAQWGMSYDLVVGTPEKDEETKLQALKQCMPFIRSCARAYAESNKHNALISEEDLISEGYVGALVALANYDDTRGAQFFTYANTVIGGFMKDYCKKNAFAFSSGLPQKAYPAWRHCVDNNIKLSVDNLMAQGLSYRTAVATIELFCYSGNSDDFEQHYDGGNYWKFFDKVEREACPFDFARHLTQTEADAIRIKFEFDEPIKTEFKSRKSREYYLDKAMMKLQNVSDIEQYLDLMY